MEIREIRSAIRRGVRVHYLCSSFIVEESEQRELMIRNTRNGNIEYIVGLDGVSINVDLDFFYTEDEQ
jgi:hypothetical protein